MTTYDKILMQNNLDLPSSWNTVRTIDMHTGGEPLRVIVEGFPALNGKTVLEKRRQCQAEYDSYRTLLMYEPRGHADMYGCILTEPDDESGDFGIIFMHNEGYSTMCGHAIIAISKLAVHMKWIEVLEGKNELKIDAPCGRIHSYVEVVEGRVKNVSFHCVPSFVIGLDKKVIVEGIGEVVFDLAYGGAFYAYVDINKNKFDFGLDSNSYKTLIEAGMAIKRAVIEQEGSNIVHPYEEDLSFLYGTIFLDNEQQASGSNSRNVCVFADGEVDRCPTGSGVAGRIAIHEARNEIKMGEIMSVESITNSVFRGSLVKKINYGPYNAVIPRVEGMAYITGEHRFVFDPEDPVKHGFLLR